MEVHKNILRIVILATAVFAILVSCSDGGKEPGIKFPVDEQGYPKNVVVINEEQYDLMGEDEQMKEIPVKLDEDAIVKVTLPQKIPTHFWTIEEKESVMIDSYNKSDADVENEVEGISSMLQDFKFTCAPGESVSFKWVNIDEFGKSFDDKESDYTLTLRFMSS